MTERTHENPPPPLSQLWQLPLLLLSILLFGSGVYLNYRGGREEQRVRYAERLDRVAALNRAGRYEPAVAELERLVEDPLVLNGALRRRYHVLRGDALYLGQRDLQWSRPIDPRGVIEAYEAAQELGEPLDPLRIKRLADSFAAAGQDGRALELLGRLGEQGAAERQDLLKRLIRTALDRPEPDADAIGDLIGRLLDDDDLSRSTEAWAAARLAELRLRQGRAAQAVDLLLRRYARLRDPRRQDRPDPALAELMVALGAAYLADGDARNAEQWFILGRAALEAEDPLNAEALVGLGRIRFAEDNIIEALEHFTDAAERYAQSPAYPRALIGRAECQARLGAVAEAMRDYTEAAKLARSASGGGGNSALRARLIRSLQMQYELRAAQADYETALAYLDLEQTLYEDKPPAEAHLRRAATQERLAWRRLGFEPAEGDADSQAAWEQADEIARREAARHYAASARAYAAHARAKVVDDDEAHGRSLWKAGDYYEKAGMHAQAIEVFRRFMDERPRDPKRLEAMFRLAQAHQSEGQFDQAAELYRQLIEQHPKSPEAYKSLVPLARSYLARGPKFLDRAEQVLRSVVTDHPALRPESREYRQALRELGRLYYRRGEEGDYERAIERLSELVERYDDPSDSPRRAAPLFQLADAYRKSARQIQKELSGSLPPSRRAALEAERARRLDLARKRFDQVIEAYEAYPPETLGELDRLYLRNSYFYRADCAYDLGAFEGPDGAIALYEQAARRYDEDPSVLTALMGIVNSFAELGRWDDARRANERARVYLEKIPEQAFSDPDLPMDRRHWQRWLESMEMIAVSQATADGGSP